MSFSDSIASRLELRGRIGNDKHKQALELAVCAQDIQHWLNWWGWTYDPRERLPTIPFLLFDKQAEFLVWLGDREQKQEPGLVEKSRDMGVTWLCATYATHGFLFHDGYKVGFGSRKLDLVDKIGDLDSILEKVRFLLQNLPTWMLPTGFKFGEHDGHTKIRNPANGAAITGEGGDQIGRGGRASIYFVDESAFLERPQLVERSLSATTNCRIDVSTPNGPGTPFTKKRYGGSVSVFTFHWRDDPRKSEEWYEQQKQQLDQVTVAQEIDIDHSASIEGITIPAIWVRAAVNLDLEAIGPLVAGLDVAAGGKNKCVLTLRQGPVVFDPITWGDRNTTQTAFKAKEEVERNGAVSLCYDVDGLGEGVRGTLDSLEEKPAFLIRAFNGAETPSTDRWPDGKIAKEKFLNARAEAYWKLRDRFRKTYEYVHDGVQHPPEEMISIPNNSQLIAELSMPLSEHTNTGKIKIESKKDMKARGIASPDHADSLVLTEVDVESPAYASSIYVTAPELAGQSKNASVVRKSADGDGSFVVRTPSPGQRRPWR